MFCVLHIIGILFCAHFITSFPVWQELKSKPASDGILHDIIGRFLCIHTKMKDEITFYIWKGDFADPIKVFI